MNGKREISVTINGTTHRKTVDTRQTLADFLRHEVGLRGTHLGCEHGVCGACTILLDGRTARSCLMLAVQTDGRAVTTVEGIARSPEAMPAVRLLYAGNADHPDGVPARQSRPDRGRGARGDLRQPLPLHRLSDDR